MPANSSLYDRRGHWPAHLALGYETTKHKTVLKYRERQGPLSVQRPHYAEDGTCHTLILHPPGGVVPGDSLDIYIRAKSGTHVLISTPGATKYYNADHRVAKITTTLDIAGTVEWLPLDNILFSGAKVVSKTRINLSKDARFFGWETFCLGRTAAGETFREGSLDAGLQLWQEQRPLQIDRTLINAPAFLSGSTTTRQLPIQSIVYATPATSQLRDEIRKKAIEFCNKDQMFATTLIGNLLIARFLGSDNREAQNSLRNLWAITREEVIGKERCPPRIWNT